MHDVPGLNTKCVATLSSTLWMILSLLSSKKAWKKMLIALPICFWNITVIVLDEGLGARKLNCEAPLCERVSVCLRWGHISISQSGILYNISLCLHSVRRHACQLSSVCMRVCTLLATHSSLPSTGCAMWRCQLAVWWMADYLKLHPLALHVHH